MAVAHRGTLWCFVSIECIGVLRHHRAMTKQPKTDFLTLRLDTDLRAALDAAARDAQRPTSSLARIVLADWIENRTAGGRPEERAAQQEASA
jgi:hypothetical protein